MTRNASTSHKLPEKGNAKSSSGDNAFTSKNGLQTAKEKYDGKRRRRVALVVVVVVVVVADASHKVVVVLGQK